MEQFPQLKKEFLTLSELTDRWSNVTNAISIKERIIAHGKDGSLRMMIVGGKCKGTIHTPYADGYQSYAETQVNKEQFTMIVDSNVELIQLIQLFNGQINEFKQSNLYRARFCHVCEASLIVSMNEILRFERKSEQYIKAKGKPSKANNRASVEELFINIPKQRSPDLLKVCIKLAERYIQKEGSIPDALIIWNMLRDEYADDYDPEKRVIEGISINGLSNRTFRKKFDAWTKITEIKDD